MSSLVELASANDADGVRRLLAEGVAVDQPNHHGETALMNARSGEMADLLIEAGANLYFTRPYGRTTLSEALSRQAFEVVEALVRAGYDLERTSEHGLTALLHLCSSGEISAERVSALLRAGANLHATAPPYGRTALHYTAQLFSGDRFGKLGPVARVLVAAGLPVDVHDDDEATPLVLAVGDEGCDVALVSTLIDLGANVNAHARYGTPLMSAATCYNARRVVPVLLAAGADISARHGRGTALDRALEHLRMWEDIAAGRIREADMSQREYAALLQRDQELLSERREVVALLRAAWPATVKMPELGPPPAPEPTPPATDKSVGELFDALESFAYDNRYVPELAAADPLEVARHGLARYPMKSMDARKALIAALGRLEDLAPVRAALLALWAPQKGRGESWYRGFGAVDGLFKAVASDPVIVDFMARDLFATDAGVNDRRHTIVELLALSHSAVAARALIRYHHEQPENSLRIVASFVELARPEPWATILLELATSPSMWRYGGLDALVASGGERAVPYLMQMIDAEECTRDVVPLLEPFPSPAVDAKLEALCAHPDGEVRMRAALVLLRHQGWLAAAFFVGVLQSLVDAGADIPFARWDQAARALQRGSGGEHPGTTLEAWRAWLTAHDGAPRTLPPVSSTWVAQPGFTLSLGHDELEKLRAEIASYLAA